MQYQLLIILSLAALLLSWVMHPWVYRYAIKHNILDRPNERKSQKRPIPMLGGLCISIGMVLPLAIWFISSGWSNAYIILIFIALALTLGVIDDIHNLSASLRFSIEILLVGAYIYMSDSMIQSFHGLWHIEMLPHWIAIILSLLTGVGIINSINLIDGIDGYSSGFGIISCSILGGVFLWLGEYREAGLLLITAAAIIPFYIYNVFGTKHKMFIGDGGTLMIGAIMVVSVFHLLSTPTPAQPLVNKGISIVALCLSVLCIPIFDTIRVMIERIARRQSPFTADTTHLHHILLSLNLSHRKTSLVILLTNLLIVIVWWGSYLLGASITIQLYVVITLGIITTFGTSFVVRKYIHKSIDK